MNGFEWFFLGVPVGAGIVLLERVLLARWRGEQLQDAPGDDGEDEDVWTAVRSLQRSQKMVIGRLNSLAPPRLGTGNESERPRIPEISDAIDKLTRQEVLRMARAKRA